MKYLGRAIVKMRENHRLYRCFDDLQQEYMLTWQYGALNYDAITIDRTPTMMKNVIEQKLRGDMTQR